MEEILVHACGCPVIIFAPTFAVYLSWYLSPSPKAYTKYLHKHYILLCIAFNYIHWLLTIYIGFLLLAVFPPKVQNHQVLYDAVFNHLETTSKAFSGFAVEDAHSNMRRIVKLLIDRIVEDSKGLPNPTCCKVCPAKVGMCPFCTQRSVHTNGKACYIGAITRLYRRFSLSLSLSLSLYNYISSCKLFYLKLYCFYICKLFSYVQHCMHVVNSQQQEDKELVQAFKQEFKQFKCNDCTCDCSDDDYCECECLDDIKCPSIMAYTRFFLIIFLIIFLMCFCDLFL